MESVATPPRYWWLKRLTLAASAASLVLACLHVWMTRSARVRFDAIQTRLRAEGKPITFSDFQRPAVPVGQCAATLILQAHANSVSTIHRSDYSEPSVLVGNRASVERYRAIAEYQVELFEHAICMLREAAKLPDADWKVVPGTPITATLLPHLSPVRSMCKLMWLSAVVEHARGRDGQAIEDLHATLRIAEHLDNGSMPTLIEHLVAIACEDLAIDGLENVIHDLAISTEDDGAVASPEQLRALMAALLDETQARQGLHRALQGERIWVMDAIEIAASTGSLGGLGGGGALLPSFIMEPIFRNNGVEIGRWFESLDGGATQADASRLAQARQFETRGQGLRAVARMLINLTVPALSNLERLQYNALARRRMAATAIAIRLFEAENGYRPATLDQLVPTYFPAVPADPFYPSAGTIRCVLSGDYPRLYSIGLDRVDDHATHRLTESSTAPSPDGRLFFLFRGFEPTHDADVVFQSRTAQPSDK